MKKSLSSQEIKSLLSEGKQFRTSNLSFKYYPALRTGLAFSVPRGSGRAVLRNKLKRIARARIAGDLFSAFSFHCLVRPITGLTKQMAVANDFILFADHLKLTLVNIKK